MSLKQYRKKRRFRSTPEPPGGGSVPRQGPLRFVVQEHAASHHHYDLRLELGGTLKSWAVPRGPSLEAGEKRLAVQTEDHPLEYLHFHGTIPAGNYGAGTMTIWDRGTYHAVGSRGRAESEAALLQGWRDGDLKLVMHGRKLRGDFKLIKMRGNDPKVWLLMKVSEEQPDLGANGKVAVRVGKGVVTLTNLNKVYWPDEGYTKRDLLAYYASIAPFILPHLQDRPLSLHRHPDGIAGASFFQKDTSRQPPPDWVQTAVIHSPRERKDIRYVLCQDEAALLYITNLGCIEINPWLSRIGSLDQPDHLAIDLDPEGIDFDQVVEAALEVRRLLDQIGAACYCKTSGQRGLHIYVPLGGRYGYAQAKLFAELVATLVYHRLPKTTSVLRTPSKRQHRVYLDFLQNRRGQTLAAPYSVRPVAGAWVSTPLKWTEVRKGLDPSRYTILTVPKRLNKLGDLWHKLPQDAIDLKDCLQRLESMLKVRSSGSDRSKQHDA